MCVAGWVTVALYVYAAYQIRVRVLCRSTISETTHYHRTTALYMVSLSFNSYTISYIIPPIREIVILVIHTQTFLTDQ